MSEFQYRAIRKDGYVAQWHTYDEDVIFGVVKRRFLINDDIESVEIRRVEPHCSRCELAVEDLGLCFKHLNEELDAYNWPDFHDEYDLYGGEPSR